MRVARITRTWLATQIEAADGDIPDLCVALTDGDECPPDKISIVISEDVEPTCPPLHIYDLDYEIRTPSGSDLTPDDSAEVEAWLDGIFAGDPDADLAEALEGIGNLNDWFVGKDGGVERYENFEVTLRTIRLAIVHS